MLLLLVAMPLLLVAMPLLLVGHAAREASIAHSPELRLHTNTRRGDDQAVLWSPGRFKLPFAPAVFAL